jgi:hypothetical protein
MTEFQEAGLRSCAHDKEDDYFLFGDITSDRTRFLANCLEDYKASKYVCFCRKGNEATNNLIKRIEKRTVFNKINVDVDSLAINSGLAILYNEISETVQQRRVTVTVDITSIDREFVMLLTSLLLRIHSNISIRFIYFSAKKYNLLKWEGLKHGHLKTLPTSPGNPCFGDNSLLILMGYETDSVSKLIYHHQPDKIVLGFNKEGVTQEAEDNNIKLFSKAMEQYSNYATIRSFECDVKDPEQCRIDILTKLREEGIVDSKNHLTQHVKLALMNTRFSIIGGMLLVKDFPEIQVVYTKPKDFKESDLSKGVQDYYEWVYNSEKND